MSSEWVVGAPGACNEFVYGDEDLIWAKVEEAADHLGPSTKSSRALPFRNLPITTQAPKEPEDFVLIYHCQKK